MFESTLPMNFPSTPDRSATDERARAHLETLFRNVPGAAWSVDRTGNVVLFNERLARDVQAVFGREMVTGNGLEPHMPKALVDEWRSLYARAFAGEVVSVQQSYPIRGQLEHFLMTVAPIYDGGVVVGALIYSMNVTERVAAESRSRESEARLAAIVQASAEGMFTTDVQGTIQNWNPAAREITGFEADDAIGRAVFEPWDASEALVSAEMFSVLRALAPVPPFETTWRRKDGSPVDVLVTTTPIVREGHFDGIALSMRDIRQQKRLQTQLVFSDRMASLGTLASGVAHEVNNPLTFVTANLDEASRELRGLVDDLRAGDNSRVAEQLERVLGALAESQVGADRVRDIVRDLRTFARVEEKVVGPVNITALLDSTVQMMWNGIRHRARLVKSYSASPVVHAVEGRLAQVFLNLLMNAVHAIPEGHQEGNQIRIGVRTTDDHRVVVEIADSGEGIEPENLGRIFDPFFTTKPVGVGTGLGLSVCHGIVASLGGTISVESERGRGSVFSVELPLGTPPESDATDGSPLEATAPRAKVVCLDDEPMVLSSLRRILSREHDVTVLARGAELLDRLVAGERFDVIVSDLMMPELSGMELFDRIAAIDSDQARRIVYITGGAFTSAAQTFLDRVPNARLEKPFDPGALRQLVRAVATTSLTPPESPSSSRG